MPPYRSIFSSNQYFHRVLRLFLWKFTAYAVENFRKVCYSTATKIHRFFLNYFYTIAHLFLIVNIFFYFPSGDCFAVSIHFSLKIAISPDYSTIFIHFIFSSANFTAIKNAVKGCIAFSRDVPAIFKALQ